MFGLTLISEFSNIGQSLNSSLPYVFLDLSTCAEITGCHRGDKGYHRVPPMARVVTNMLKVLLCPFSEMEGFEEYVNEQCS